MEGRRWCTGGSGGNFKMTQTLTQMFLTQLLFFDTTFFFLVKQYILDSEDSNYHIISYLTVLSNMLMWAARLEGKGKMLLNTPLVGVSIVPVA